MGALQFGIGLELRQDFGCNGRITADALIEADPGPFFLVFDAGAPGARTGVFKGHGVFSIGGCSEHRSPFGEAVDSPGLHGHAAL